MWLSTYESKKHSKVLSLLSFLYASTVSRPHSSGIYRVHPVAEMLKERLWTTEHEPVIDKWPSLRRLMPTMCGTASRRRPASLQKARRRHPGRRAGLCLLINAILWLITSSADVSFNDTSHQNTSVWMDVRLEEGRGEWIEEKNRRDISVSEHQRKPSNAPSHPIRSILASQPLCRSYLNNNCH